MTVYLETDRLIMRDWHKDDLECFTRINSDPVIMEYYPGRLDRVATEHLVGHFQDHISEQGFGFYAVEHKEDGRFVGFAGLSHVLDRMPFSPAVEIAWRFDYDYWGKGYATEATKKLIEYGFEDLKLPEIVAYCVESNVRADHLLQRLGFDYTQDDNFEYAPQRSPDKSQLYHLYTLKSGS